MALKESSDRRPLLNTNSVNEQFRTRQLISRAWDSGACTTDWTTVAITPPDVKIATRRPPPPPLTMRPIAFRMREENEAHDSTPSTGVSPRIQAVVAASNIR